MILTCSLRFLTLPLIKFSFSFSVFCGNRTGIVFMIFLSLYVFLRFLTWRARHSQPLFARKMETPSSIVCTVYEIFPM